jgi:ABC-type nickel/cobalt efflux system permease component RcnA
MNDFLNPELLQMINPNVVLRSIIVYIFVVWFCIVVWVVRDITNRTKSITFQILSIVLVLLLTPLGIFIYLLIRPQKTLFEKVFEEEFLKLDDEHQKEEHSHRRHANSVKSED